MSEKTVGKIWPTARVTWCALCSGSIRSFYDRISSIYETTFTDHLVHVENIVALLAHEYPDREKCSILDLGSGTGLLSKALSKRGFRVFAMDISRESLKVLQHSDQRVPLIQGDAVSFPLDRNSFKVVVCLGVWRHLLFPDKVLEEICRVLSSNGAFVLGYFPPKLGGLSYVTNNALGRLLASIYSNIAYWFGYCDRVTFDFNEWSWQAVCERFDHTRKIQSGEHWHLIHATR